MELLKKFDISSCPNPAGIKDGQPYWTGKQIFSSVLPKGLNLNFKADFCYNCDVCKGEDCENDAYVVINDGQLLKGTIDAEAIGAFKGKITDRIIKEYSPTVASAFLDRMTLLALRGIMYAGFSFGIDDEDIPKAAAEQIEETTRTARENVEQLIEAYNAGELEPLPGRTLDETLEMSIMQTLGKARDSAGKIAGRYLGLDNSGVVMAVSGARGCMLNLTQMAACVGQQSVRGERICEATRAEPCLTSGQGTLVLKPTDSSSPVIKMGLTPQNSSSTP